MLFNYLPNFSGKQLRCVDKDDCKAAGSAKLADQGQGNLQTAYNSLCQLITDYIRL